LLSVAKGCDGDTNLKHVSPKEPRKSQETNPKFAFCCEIENWRRTCKGLKVEFVNQWLKLGVIIPESAAKELNP
jgi:hypothetical protein